ncbi:MAG: hypothetical protein ACKVTZ_08595 [Bacteroidia bacterium]
MKRLSFLLLLSCVSLLFTHCTNNRSTGCQVKEYFEVTNISTLAFQRYHIQTGSLQFSQSDSNLHQLYQGEYADYTFKFNVSFFNVGQVEPPKTRKPTWDFSPFPSAYAVFIPEDPCAQFNGKKGTPDKVKSFTIMSKSDFDATHAANTSLNSYFKIMLGFSGEQQPLEEWLTNVLYQEIHNREFQTSLYTKSYGLRLEATPNLNQIHDLYVKIEFQDGRMEIQDLPKFYYQ